MKRIEGGYTLWARQTTDSEIFYTKPDKWFKIWFFIVNRVFFSEYKKWERGECFMTYSEIMEKTGATKDQIDKCIRWLKKCSMLATQKATRGMNVKVLNYDVYQDSDSYTSDSKSDLKAIQKRYRSDTITEEGKEWKEYNTCVSKISDNFKSLIDDKYLAIVEEWLEYKESKKQMYKTEKGFKGFYNKLIKFSGDDVKEAEAIVRESIKKGWQGLVERKNSVRVCHMLALAQGLKFDDEKQYKTFLKANSYMSNSLTSSYSIPDIAKSFIYCIAIGYKNFGLSAVSKNIQIAKQTKMQNPESIKALGRLLEKSETYNFNN